MNIVRSKGLKYDIMGVLMYICKCTKKREQDIREMVNMGLQCWEEASAKSGAGRYCGSCLSNFRRAFQQKLSKKTAAIGK